jgi:hypothetical protein
MNKLQEELRAVHEILVGLQAQEGLKPVNRRKLAKAARLLMKISQQMEVEVAAVTESSPSENRGLRYRRLIGKANAVLAWIYAEILVKWWDRDGS